MSEEDLIDEEILEIFVEEAAEVLETINEFFPQWRADPSNDDARTTVRRSFHTLKGSGRMVQAYEIGELAWSVENMLNRVLDGTIEINDGIFDLIQQVVDVVPGMVKSFEDRTPITVNVQPLMSAADAYSKGQSPAPVTVQAAAAEPAPAAEGAEAGQRDTIIDAGSPDHHLGKRVDGARGIALGETCFARDCGDQFLLGHRAPVHAGCCCGKAAA